MRRNRLLIISASLALTLLAASCQRVAPPLVSSTPSAAESSTTTSSASVTTSSASVTTTSVPSDTTSTTTASVVTTTTTLTTASTSTAQPSTSASTLPVETSTGVTTAVVTSPSSSTRATRDPLDEFFEIINGTTQSSQAGSFSNPYSIGETATFDGYDTLFDPFRADVSVQEVFRGPQALQMVKDASSLNPEPRSGQEYMVAQVLVKITASLNGESVGVSPYFFSLARQDGRMYGDVTLFRAIPPVLSTINVGETSIGYICFQVDKDDEDPFIVFLSRAHGGIWFHTSELRSESGPDVTTSFRSKD